MKNSERSYKAASERRRSDRIGVVTDDTMFNDVITVREFCVKLEVCQFVITRVEKMMGVKQGSIWRKMNREPWKKYFAKKYPRRYGYKDGSLNRTKKDFFTVTEIVCMSEKCNNIVKVEHEAGTKLARGFRKRCHKCNHNVSDSGLSDKYHNYRG